MNEIQRIEVIDAMRGFALLGILFIHVYMFFLAGPFSPEIEHSAVQSSLDRFLRQFIYWAALSKFYSIFAFLFGLSFYVQMRSAQIRAGNFNLRFAWRLLILAGFGILHWSYYPGDILVLYALVGLLLIPLNTLKDRSLIILAILLFLGVGRTLFFMVDQDGMTFVYDWTQLYGQFLEAVFNGSFIDTAKASYSRMVIFWDEHFNLWGRFYNTLSYFIFGLLVARKGWLENIGANLPLFQRTCAAALAASILFGSIHVIWIGHAWELFLNPHDQSDIIVKYGVFDLYSLSLSTFYASAFILLAYRFRETGLINLLRSYGRMALTIFMTQSLLGTFLFFNWGLGLIKHITVSQCTLAFLGIAILQITFAHYWLRHFYYGPLEWIWRSLTYGKLITNRREPHPETATL